jgi:hypothetical protein
VPREVELRLRAAYEASADLVADSMSDQDPILGADRADLTVGVKHPRWRTPLLAAVAVLIVTAGTVLAIDQARSHRAASPPTSSASSLPQPAPPALLRSRTHSALTANMVLRLDQPVEWVKTTSHKWAAAQGINAGPLPADVDIYIVQIRGSFVCGACKSPVTIKGSVMVLELPLKPNQQIGEGFAMGNTAYDLSRAGTVHTFTGA